MRDPFDAIWADYNRRATLEAAAAASRSGSSSGGGGGWRRTVSLAALRSPGGWARWENVSLRLAHGHAAMLLDYADALAARGARAVHLVRYEDLAAHEGGGEPGEGGGGGGGGGGSGGGGGGSGIREDGRWRQRIALKYLLCFLGASSEGRRGGGATAGCWDRGRVVCAAARAGGMSSLRRAAAGAQSGEGVEVPAESPATAADAFPPHWACHLWRCHLRTAALRARRLVGDLAAAAAKADVAVLDGHQPPSPFAIPILQGWSWYAPPHQCDISGGDSDVSHWSDGGAAGRCAARSPAPLASVCYPLGVGG